MKAYPLLIALRSLMFRAESGPYDPMQLGRRLYDTNYEVVRKLGYSSYARVWLALGHTCV
ncbi:hypothetical protein BD414DRAFT_498490 [Trametes punicea]|nr:hypothetical protein BD414DRAFT_498490 [Trametes punicea]